MSISQDQVPPVRVVPGSNASPGASREPVPARVGWGSVLLVLAGFFVLVFLVMLLGVIGIVLVLILSAWELRHWYANQDHIVTEVGGVPADPARDADLVDMVSELADRARVRNPRVLITDDPELNAFALSGSSGGIVMVTREALTVWDQDELYAVLAHEVGHLRNRDTLWTILSRILIKAALAPAAVVVLVIALLSIFSDDDNDTEFAEAFMAVFAIVGVWISTLTLAYANRSRELMADQSAVDLGGRPESLISALGKAEQRPPASDGVSFTRALLAPTMLVNPMRESIIDRLISTHPPLSKRAERVLRRLDDEQRAEAEASVRERSDRQAAELELTRWRRRLADVESRLALARATGASRTPTGAREHFRLRRDEQLVLFGEADLLEIRRPEGRDVLVPTEVGLAAITTRGLVFASDRRTRWDFATVTHAEWPDHHSAVFATTTRKKVSGVVFHDREVDWQTMAEATQARAFGRWAEYEAELVGRVAELRRERPGLT